MEFLVLNELNSSENLDFPHDSYDQFNLDDMDEAECIAKLRFEKRHTLRLEEVLPIPPLMKCNQRSVFTGTEGLLTLVDTQILFIGKPVPVLGMTTNSVIGYIYDCSYHFISGCLLHNIT